MRSAYSGRAAALEKKGDNHKALADHNMAVLYYAIEAEILTGLQSEDRAKFLVDTAHAYRARASCLEALNRTQDAARDRKTADRWEANGKKLEEVAQTREGAAAVEVINAWTRPITLVVAGDTYRLDIGEQKQIPLRTSTASFEMQAGIHRSTGTLQAGKAYTIRPNTSP